MERSNLRLYSNIFPWDGRWTASDADFISKIWDERALDNLRVAESHRRECVLSEHQHEIIRHATPCPKLEMGENPFGWRKIVRSDGVSSVVKVCCCRKVGCEHFSECRPNVREVPEREVEIWSQGNQDGLEEFARKWDSAPSRPWGGNVNPIDLSKVMRDGEYTDNVPPVNPQKPVAPRCISGFPQDEEYVDVSKKWRVN